MTGFAQARGLAGDARWTWDIKTVNAKGLDLRLRAPTGLDALEIEARKVIGARLTRGTCHATLTVARDSDAPAVRLNLELLTSLARTLDGLDRPPDVGPATLDGLLGVRGVVELDERAPDAAATGVLAKAALAGLDEVLAGLVAVREAEGAALEQVLRQRLDRIAALTAQADAAPQRRPEAVREKLARTIAELAGRHALEPDRLHQEALILAAKADVREELDRLATHVVAARALLDGGGAVGRRLDFLAQELGREASTYCAKANDAALTAIGLELRVEIEQFREQVQNIE
jgi:uncharacterized protein (TIGR00255 family)